jgi:hypothetical protein
MCREALAGLGVQVEGRDARGLQRFCLLCEAHHGGDAALVAQLLGAACATSMFSWWLVSASMTSSTSSRATRCQKSGSLASAAATRRCMARCSASLRSLSSTPSTCRAVAAGDGLVGAGADIAHAQHQHLYVARVRQRGAHPRRFVAQQRRRGSAVQAVRGAVEGEATTKLTAMAMDIARSTRGVHPALGDGDGDDDEAELAVIGRLLDASRAVRGGTWKRVNRGK